MRRCDDIVCPLPALALVTDASVALHPQVHPPGSGTATTPVVYIVSHSAPLSNVSSPQLGVLHVRLHSSVPRQQPCLIRFGHSKQLSMALASHGLGAFCDRRPVDDPDVEFYRPSISTVDALTWKASVLPREWTQCDRIDIPPAAKASQCHIAIRTPVLELLPTNKAVPGAF